MPRLTRLPSSQRHCQGLGQSLRRWELSLERGTEEKGLSFSDSSAAVPPLQPFRVHQSPSRNPCPPGLRAVIGASPAPPRQQAAAGDASVPPAASSPSVKGSVLSHSGSLKRGGAKEVRRGPQVLPESAGGADPGSPNSPPAPSPKRKKTGTQMLLRTPSQMKIFGYRAASVVSYSRLSSALSPETQFSSSVVETEEGGGRRHPSAFPSTPLPQKHPHPTPLLDGFSGPQVREGSRWGSTRSSSHHL